MELHLLARISGTTAGGGYSLACPAMAFSEERKFEEELPCCSGKASRRSQNHRDRRSSKLAPHGHWTGDRRKRESRRRRVVSCRFQGNILEKAAKIFGVCAGDEIRSAALCELVRTKRAGGVEEAVAKASLGRRGRDERLREQVGDRLDSFGLGDAVIGGNCQCGFERERSD